MAADAFKLSYGYPAFDRITYFPGGYLTGGFGLDNVLGPLRVHLGVDRAGGPVVHVPFDCDGADLFSGPVAGSFGTLLILSVSDADFEVRIAHLNPSEFHPPFLERFDDGDSQYHMRADAPIPAGTPIGPPGNLGVSTEAHLHTEIVSSFREYSRVCNELTPHQEPITKETAREFARRNGMDEEAAERSFLGELERRNIEVIYTTWARRIDYLTGRLRSFYSSWALFNHM